MYNERIIDYNKYHFEGLPVRFSSGFQNEHNACWIVSTTVSETGTQITLAKCIKTMLSNIQNGYYNVFERV